MNKNDSEIVCGLLEAKGAEQTSDINSANIIIANTCSVRDTAERKAKGFINDLGKLKKRKNQIIIGVIGCMAERMGEDIFKKYNFVDFVLGPNKEAEIEKVISFFEDKSGNYQKILCLGDSPHFKNSFVAKRQPSVNAWITIMEGCDNFCSYCIVPYLRGREKSRPIDEIIKEIDMLDKDIFKEITLLGQNVNSYKYGLSNLFIEAAKIEGIKRIRFMTSHPKDISDEIIHSVKTIDKVCEFFHLPMQSGDDEILKAMNRGYDSSYYKDLVKKIRDKIPSAAIGSDFIVGFPGETEKQFENTLKAIEEIEFDSANTFAYNTRPGTKAANLPNQLPRDLISRRLQQLIEVVEKVTMKKNSKLVGSVQEVLVEDNGIGRTRTNKIVKFKDEAAKYKRGDIVFVKVESAKSWVLQGKLND